MTPSLGLPLLLISLPLLWVSPKLLPHPTVPPKTDPAIEALHLLTPKTQFLLDALTSSSPNNFSSLHNTDPLPVRGCISSSRTAHKTNKLKTTFLTVSLTHSLPHETFIFLNLNHPPIICHSGSHSLPPFSPFPDFSRRLLQPFAVFFNLPSVLQEASSKHPKFSLYPLQPLRPSSLPLTPPYPPVRTGHPK